MVSTFYNEKEKLWYGPNKPPLYNPDISLAQALLNSMANFGPKIAQINDTSGNQMTYSQFHRKVVRTAQNLQAMGYQPKQTFGMVARCSDNVAPIIVASVAIGCPILGLHYTLKRTNILQMYRFVEPVLVFCDVDSYELVKDCLRELNNQAKIFTFDGYVGDSVAVDSLFKDKPTDGHPCLFIPANVDGPNDTATFTCTSGTTGQPKIVRFSHGALLDEICEFNHILNYNEIVLDCDTLNFAGVLYFFFRSILHGETRIVTNEDFSPEVWCRLIDKYGVTYALSDPFQLLTILDSEHLKKANLSSLKCSIVVGGQFPQNLKSKLDARYPNGCVISTYGQSELAGPLSIDYPLANKPETSQGRLIHGGCVKIVDDNGNRCGISEKGELRVKRKHMFPGYFKNQAATDSIFDEEGFHITGDIGYFDVDGDLFVCGRKKEIIKFGRFTILPAEIDNFLVKHPDISCACVVGVPVPEGELPAAVIVRKPGASISEKEIQDLVADNLADHYKLRGGVYFVDALPWTKSGKIIRRQVREMAIEQREKQ